MCKRAHCQTRSEQRYTRRRLLIDVRQQLYWTTFNVAITSLSLGS